MKAIEFKEVNIHIGENQQEYETLPAHIDISKVSTPTTVCIELDEEERKQVTEAGRVWIQMLAFGKSFHPIRMSLLCPDGFTEPTFKKRYYIYLNDGGSFVCYKTKKQKKSHGKLVGEFIGILTEKPISERFEYFCEGNVVSLYDGKHIEVVKNIWFEI